MRETSIDAILGDFDPSGNESPGTRRTTLTLWVPVELKERYERLQRRTKGSGARFSTKLRQVVEAAIDVAEGKAS